MLKSTSVDKMLKNHEKKKKKLLLSDKCSVLYEMLLFSQACCGALVGNGWTHQGRPLGSPPPPPPTRSWLAGLVLQGRDRLAGEEGCRGGRVWKHPEDTPHSLGPALPEHHPGPHTKVLWVLDELEPTECLVPSP